MSHLDVLAKMCKETNAINVHEWVSHYNELSGQNISPIGLILKMNEKGANIETEIRRGTVVIIPAGFDKKGVKADVTIRFNATISSDIELFADHLNKVICAEVKSVVKSVPKGKKRTCRVWTQAEDDLIIDRSQPVEEMASLLGRTKAAIYTRRKHLKVKE